MDAHYDILLVGMCLDDVLAPAGVTYHGYNADQAAQAR